jgi:uncharacterized protein (TIGR02099 family)
MLFARLPLSKHLRFLRPIRWLFWIGLSLLVLILTLYGFLQFYLVDHIHHFRPWLQERLTKILNAQVEIGSIHASRSGVLPTLSVRDLRIQKQIKDKFKTVLYIPFTEVDFTIDSKLNLGFEFIQIQQPEVSIDRTSMNTLAIGGYEIDLSGPSTPYFRDQVFSQGHIKIYGGRLYYQQFDTDQVLQLHPIDFSIENQNRNHRINIAFALADTEGSRVEIGGNFTHSLFSLRSGNWDQWQGQLQAKFDSFHFTPIIRAFGLPIPLETAQFDAGLSLQWDEGNIVSTEGYVDNLILLASSVKDRHMKEEPPPLIPSISGASLQFQTENPYIGQANLAIKKGWVEFPGVFTQPRIPLGHLKTQLEWNLLDQENIQLELQELFLSNTDLTAKANIKWHSNSEYTLSDGGYLSVDGSLNQVQANRVYRYLPLTLDTEVRRYVQKAIQGGEIERAEFTVEGGLNKPFSKKGFLTVNTEVKNIVFNYLPTYLQPEGALPWLPLEQLNGDLRFTDDSVEIIEATAKLRKAPNIILSGLNAQIDSFDDALLQVQSKATGPVQELLSWLDKTPISQILPDQVTKQTEVKGDAAYSIQIEMPLENSGDDIKVAGQIEFTENVISMRSDLPRLTQVNGTLHFDQNGFAIDELTANVLGDHVVIHAGMKTHGGQRSPRFNISGRLSTEALRIAPMKSINRFSHLLAGNTDYQLDVGFIAGQPTLNFVSTLQGLEIKLPPPFQKSQDSVLPLAIERLIDNPPQNIEDNEQALFDILNIRLGKDASLANISYRRNLETPIPSVVQGSIALGLGLDEVAPLPMNRVGANIRLDTLDLDGWLQTLENLTDTVDLSPEQEFEAFIKDISTDSSLDLEEEKDILWMDYLPTVVALRTQDLTVGRYRLTDLLVGGTRNKNQWLLNASAQELSGYIQYRQASSETAEPLLFTRLAYLKLGQSEVDKVKELVNTQPRRLPNLDIGIDDLTLNDFQLGQLDFIAQNDGDDIWEIRNLTLTTDASTFKADGSWQISPTAESIIKDQKRVRLNFNLNTQNAGELLTRFKQPDTLGGGNGTITGHITWVGSPLSIPTQALGGQINVNLNQGRIVQVDPGAIKLLEILSLQFLTKIFSFGKQDHFGKGFPYNQLSGSFIIDNGNAMTENLSIENSGLATIEISGNANFIQDQCHFYIEVSPQLDFSTAAIAAGVLNPAFLAILPAQWFFSRWLSENAGQHYAVSGNCSNPYVQVTKKRP